MELNQHAEEYRNIINMMSEEMEALKERLKAMSKCVESVGVPNLLTLLEGPDIDVKKVALKALANVAAEKKRKEIVAYGTIGKLLRLVHELDDEGIHRLAVAAVANIAMDPAHQSVVVEEGWLPILVRLSQEAEDPQTLRMVAGALANLCANPELKERMDSAGVIEALIGLSSTQHPDVRVQVARGVANWVVKNNKADKFIDAGGLPCLIAMAGSASDINVKKHVGIALYHIVLSCAATVIPILEQLGGLQPLEDMKKCASSDVSSLATRTLALLDSARSQMHSA